METRFMQVMFSATENQDAELTDQVGSDLKEAKENGTFETDEVTYVNLGSGKVLVIDNENGESTVIEEDPEDAEKFSLEGFETPDEALEKYLHPGEDGVTPNEDVKTEVTENVEEDHLDGSNISDLVDDTPVNEEDGECSESGECEGTDEEGEEEEKEEEQHEYSNAAVSKLFSNSDFYCRLFSEVVSEGKPSIVGDLKFEVDEEDPETIVVTDLESGDAAQVNINEEGEAIVNELQKECSDEDEVEEDEVEDNEQFEPLYVVGVNADSNEIVDSPVYSEEDAEFLAQRLSEIGIEGVEIFDDQEEARDHAMNLLGELEVSDVEAHAEPEEKVFSDFIVYTTRYFSDKEIESYYSDTVTSFMERMFSEAEDEITDSQDIIEDAIESGEQVEDGDLVVTPIDGETAIVADKENDEYTKVTLEDKELDVEKIDEETADELTKGIEVGDEKKFSEYGLKVALFSEVADKVSNAIESGEEVDNDSEKITPIDENTAIVYDKDNEEFTKVTLGEDKDINTEVITEEEADKELEKTENKETEEESKEESEEDKKFSTLNKFFADAEVNPETGDPVGEAPVEEGEENVEAPAPVETSVEGIEDKALEAVQSIQEAANNAVLAIQEAKEAPAPGEEEDLKEAHFSDNNPVMENWLKTL